MQNSWAGAKRSGAKTRWSYPSKKDTQNMAPFPMSQEAQHSIGKEHSNTKDIILFCFFVFKEPRCSLITLHSSAEAFFNEKLVIKLWQGAQIPRCHIANLLPDSSKGNNAALNDVDAFQSC